MIVLGFVFFAVFSTSVAKGSPFRSTRGIEDGPILTTPELANMWGYETEEHDVITEDGYILSIFRVKRKDESVSLEANVLLLLSGYLSSSDHYFLMTEKPVLFHLVDDGYDVWLGNVRGSRYGKRHKILSPTDIDFWDFSNHELGVYDVPAIIDYVLNKTNSKKLVYTGYSQGTTIFFIMMSERPEYNEKVAMMLALAPVAYFNHSTNIGVRIIGLYGLHLLEFARNIRSIELLSIEGPLVDLSKVICTDPNLFRVICRPLAWQFLGTTTNGQNDDAVRQLIKYSGSAALKAGVHYGQILSSGKFRQYKYPTRVENLQKYGSLEPPEYNVKNTRIPVILIAATDDRLANLQDVETLVKELPNVLYYEVFPYRYYGHYSMAAAKNASKYIYKTILPFLSHISFR